VSKKKKRKEEKEGDHLSEALQTAIWLIGLAILAWQGWWWPGILVLVAISGVTEAVLRQYGSRREQAVDAQQQEADAAAMRAALVPDVCPNCGSPVTPDAVEWNGPVTATCPYCAGVVTNRVRTQATTAE
jgi:hypothetical protein